MTTLEYNAGKRRLDISGSLVFGNISSLMRGYESPGPVREINLAEVDSVDSAGVAFLLWLSDRVGDKNDPFEISGYSDRARTLFQVANLEHLLAGER